MTKLAYEVRPAVQYCVSHRSLVLCLFPIIFFYLFFLPSFVMKDLREGRKKQKKNKKNCANRRESGDLLLKKLNVRMFQSYTIARRHYAEYGRFFVPLPERRK